MPYLRYYCRQEQKSPDVGPVTSTGADSDLYLVIPAEVWGDDQADAEDGARDGLDGGLHRDGGNLVDALFDCQADTHVVQHVSWGRDGGF